MKTSTEIKEFIIERLEDKNITEIYFEVFYEISSDKTLKGIKALNYKWMAACNEVRKELNRQDIDETLFRSIICYNAMCKFSNKPIAERKKYMREWKRLTGWDVEAIANGKHCSLAQEIIDVFNFYKIINP